MKPILALAFLAFLLYPAKAAPVGQRTYQCVLPSGCKIIDEEGGTVVKRKGDIVSVGPWRHIEGDGFADGWRRIDPIPKPAPKPEPVAVKSWWRRLLGL